MSISPRTPNKGGSCFSTGCWCRHQEKKTANSSYTHTHKSFIPSYLIYPISRLATNLRERILLVRLVRGDKKEAASIAEKEFHRSRCWAYKWLKRFDNEQLGSSSVVVWFQKVTGHLVPYLPSEYLLLWGCPNDSLKESMNSDDG